MKIIQDISTLHQVSSPVDSVEEALEIIKKLEEALSQIDYGVGLAAIQIGALKTVGVIKRENKPFFHLINPEVIELLDPFIFANEGCLSFPNVFKDTRRYRQVMIKNKRIEGDHFEDEILSFYYSSDPEEPGNDGLVCIALQHELEHFTGKLIIDHNIVGVTIVRDEVKIGRNDPCGCGSGKKYKKCCGKNN